ncbi:MAG: hypothetical protein GY755_15665 [Chloroflexi bacterium]|nr:hypothetical protein [Chloroflexota bacterium]
MNKKTVKLIKWIIGLLFFLAFALGAYSSLSLASKPASTWELAWQEKCLDSTGDFLFGGTISIIGFCFIVFPRQMMRLLIKDEKAYNSFENWRLIASGIAAGTLLFWAGINFLAGFPADWITHCYPSFN